MSQDANSTSTFNKKAQGFLGAEGAEAPADLSVCSTGKLDVTSDNIEEISLENDTLVITLKDGAEVKIENFKAVMAASGITELTLADRTVIDLETLDPVKLTVTDDETGETTPVLASSETAPANDFPAPSEQTLEEVITQGQEDTTESIVDEVTSIAPAAGEEQMQETAQATQTLPSETVATIEPSAGNDMTTSAEALAAIAPAAGDNPAGGAAGRQGGYGFNSSADPIQISSLSAIGPIAPTQLNYGLNRPQDDLGLILEDPLLPPTLTINGGLNDVIVKEDQSVFVPITVLLQGPNTAGQVLTITISGINETTATAAGFSAAGTPGIYSLTLPAGSNYDGGLTFTPAAQSDLDFGSFSVNTTVTLPATGQSATTAEEATVTTDAVADVPVVDGVDAATFKGQPLDINITGSLQDDLDGSETITGYEVSGVPTGFTFTAGTYDPVNDVWTFDPANLVGLQIIPPADYVGTLDLTVTVFNAETTLSDTESDTSDNTNSASDAFSLSWADGPLITYTFTNQVDADTGLVKEDSSVGLQLNVQNSLNVGPISGDEILTITLSGLQTGWTINLPGAAGANWQLVSAGTYSITLPAGSNYSDLLTFTPPANSDADHPQFTISASVFDPVLNLTQNAAATADILTDAVIDTPTLNVQNVTATEGDTVPFNIIAAIGETSNISESITSIQVSGLPAGATLNQYQSFDSTTGIWTLSPANLGGLMLTLPVGTTGNSTITVTVTSREDVAAGDSTNGEADFSDNSLTISKDITLSIGDDSVPTADPESVTVDESLLPGTLSQTGTLNVDFGADNTGTQITTNTSVPTGLTSGGLPVTVTGSGSIYTATLPNGTVIFTLTFHADGTYTYEQVGPLDHAEGTATDDTLPLQFGVTIIDGDGSTITTTLTVNVLDDNPLAVDDIRSIDENITNDITGNIITNDDPGADVPATVTIVTFGGVNYTLPANGTSLTINGQYGTLSINNSGTYAYTITAINPPNGTETFTYVLTDKDGDTSSAKLEITLIATDDQPKLTTSTITLDETSFHNTNVLSKNGTVSAAFGNDGPGTITANGDAPTGLTVNGAPVTVAHTATGYTGTLANGTTVFTLTLNGNGTYTYKQYVAMDHPDPTNANESMSLSFGVTATDADLDVDTGFIVVKILDDAPIARNDVNTIDLSIGHTDGNVITGVNGGASAKDTLSADTSTQLISVNGVTLPTDGSSIQIKGLYGTLTINNTGAYTYDVDTMGTATTTYHLAPTETDVAGLENSVHKGGVTVSIQNTGEYDLVWVDTDTNLISGLGIDNLSTNDEQTVWPSGETFRISYDADVARTTLSLIIPNVSPTNDNLGIDYVIHFADGTTMSAETHILAKDIVNGVYELTLDSAQLGGQLISYIELNSTNAGSYIATPFLLADVTASYTDALYVDDQFTYVLQDADDDQSSAILRITGTQDIENNILIVGENVSDISSETTPWAIGQGSGEITGQSGNDILIGDVGGSRLENIDQDYNFLFVLDISNSMNELGATSGETKISLLKDALENLLNDFGAYQNGDIRVHFTPFNTTALVGATFTITDAGQLQAAIDWVNKLSADGFTNYESALQDGISWLQSSDPINGAITTTYFLSDGEPNLFVNTSGAVEKGYTTGQIINELTGVSDGSDEVGILNTLSDEVISIGIDVTGDLPVMNLIDQNGALIITEPEDLSLVLNGTNPLIQLASVGDDTITGGFGNDLIYGDSVNTDALATAQGLNGMIDGASWSVFEALEACLGTNSSWSRADTLAYIRTHMVELAEETIDTESHTRTGGNDTLNGGAGEDVIFGQEGNDLIDGGTGDDLMYGGSGADTFLFSSNAGHDNIIGDFDAQEGDVLDFSGLLETFDPLTDAITDFVTFTEIGGHTIVSVDTNGLDLGTSFANVVTLQNVTGLDVDTLYTQGTIVA